MAPTDSLPVVRYNDKTGSRALDLMRWGLVPYWAKDIKVSFANINAMAETVDTKPAFKTAFAKRRCLVPIEAFYEWKKLGPKEKQSYAIAIGGGGFMALAGFGKTGNHRPVSGCAALPSSPVHRTSFAPKFITGCR